MTLQQLKENKTKLQGGYIIDNVLSLDLIHSTYKEHRRLRVFHNKGCKCVKCGEIGTLLLDTVQINKKGIIISRHVNLYSDNLKLMTIDHIHPKSKGGSDDIDNLQPMCMTCNNKKSNKIEYKE